MAVTQNVKSTAGVREVVVSMGTPSNIEMLQSAGLMSEAVLQAGPADLIIGYDVESDEVIASLERAIDLSLKGGSSGGSREEEPASIATAVRSHADAGLAVISVPGQHAAREARQALSKGLNVMIFSDNVSLEDEIALKQQAHEAGLFVMGPDCGTAIINGVGLCFANVVRRGSIGVVGASGTGMQEVTVLVDREGGGISQAIGTGGRDVSEAVGGIMVIDAIRALQKDADTEVIVIVSKPPAASVADRILAVSGESAKPVVACFLGLSSAPERLPSNVVMVSTLEDAAKAAVSRSGATASPATEAPEISVVLPDISGSYVRGLFCGGTLCEESRLVFESETGLPGFGNTGKSAHTRLVDARQSRENSFVDLGDDVFTVGRPHPMIEPALRNDRLVSEACDPETAVILVDVMLGYGSHPDPAGETIHGIREAKKARGVQPLAFIAYVCGTEADPQRRSDSEGRLAAEGVLLAATNAEAARLAARLVSVHAGVK